MRPERLGGVFGSFMNLAKLTVDDDQGNADDRQRPRVHDDEHQGHHGGAGHQEEVEQQPRQHQEPVHDN